MVLHSTAGNGPVRVVHPKAKSPTTILPREGNAVRNFGKELGHVRHVLAHDQTPSASATASRSSAPTTTRSPVAM